MKKGTKILSKTSVRIPSPLSDIVNVGLSLEKNFICISLSIFRSHVSRAFFNKLISTCSICARSTYKNKLVGEGFGPGGGSGEGGGVAASQIQAWIAAVVPIPGETWKQMVSLLRMINSPSLRMTCL